MDTAHDQLVQPVENDEQKAEECALEHFDRDLGMNYDGGFGSLLEDTASADLARTYHDHRIVEE